jgi:hypothetical protein
MDTPPRMDSKRDRFLAVRAVPDLTKGTSMNYIVVSIYSGKQYTNDTFRSRKHAELFIKLKFSGAFADCYKAVPA